MKFYVYFGLATVMFLSLWSCAVEQSQQLKSDKDHFIVIGIDGLSIDGIHQADTPQLDQMIVQGASSLKARSVLPSSSSPNWASMIMGAGPEQHGITSNGWQPDEHLLPASVINDSGRFPTIFSLFKAQLPDAIVGAVYDWGGFGRLFGKDDVDFDFEGEDEIVTVNKAIEVLLSKKPQFTFVHLDHVDHAGHTYGHGSKNYYASINRADSLLHLIVESTKKAGMFDRTTFLIASDHGGVGFGHGGESLAEMQVPFILFGDKVKNGYVIETPVNQFDQAATVAYAFGLKMPYAWVGKPIKHAFEGNKSPDMTYRPDPIEVAPIFVPNKRVYTPQGGLFYEDTLKVELAATSKGNLRYTIDSPRLSISNSYAYNKPIEVTKDAVILAGVFDNNRLISEIGRASYSFADSTELKVNVKGYFFEGIERFPDTEALIPDIELKTAHFALDTWFERLPFREHIALEFESTLYLSQPGLHTFYLNSDDGSLLYLDDQLLVDNDGDHGVIEQSNTIELTSGQHQLKVKYFNGGGGYHLDLSIKGVDGVKRLVAPSMLIARNK